MNPARRPMMIAILLAAAGAAGVAEAETVRKLDLSLPTFSGAAPQAVLFSPELKRDDYIKRAGGFSERGRNGRVLIRHANGAIELDRSAALRPGDELVVLPYIDPKMFQLGVDVVSLIFQVALGAAVFNFL